MLAVTPRKKISTIPAIITHTRNFINDIKTIVSFFQVAHVETAQSYCHNLMEPRILIFFRCSKLWLALQYSIFAWAKNFHIFATHIDHSLVILSILDFINIIPRVRIVNDALADFKLIRFSIHQEQLRGLMDRLIALDISVFTKWRT